MVSGSGGSSAGSSGSRGCRPKPKAPLPVKAIYFFLWILHEKLNLK